MRLYTSKRCLEHVTGGHVERPERLQAAWRALEDVDVERAEPSPLAPETAERVHAASMLERTRTMCEDGGGWLDVDTTVSEGSWEAALVSAGGVLQGARDVASGDVESSYALVRPPGHHATRTRAMGFCLVSNVALAARVLLDEGLAARVAILDHDVHHGNGTQDILYDDPDALYVSIHQSPLYPGTGDVGEVGTGDGEGATVNVPVPAGLDDAAYLGVIEEVVCPVAARFDPDLWLVSAGYDAHADDPLAGLELSTACFAAILDRIADVCPRMALALEGGYDLDALSASVAAQVRWLAGERDVDLTADAGAVEGIVGKVREAQEGWWDL